MGGQNHDVRRFSHMAVYHRTCSVFFNEISIAMILFIAAVGRIKRKPGD